MNAWAASAGAIAIAYILGSIPFSYLVVKARTSRDVRQAGSGNVGTTNALRVAGKAVALLALIGDLGKGVAAVFLARWLVDSPAAAAGAAVAAVFGHIRPLFLRFGGGKGAATGLGAIFALAPAAGVMCLVVLACVIAATGYVSVGTIVTAASAPALVLIAQHPGWVAHDTTWASPLAMAAIAVMIVIKHRNNLQRLRAGQEPKLREAWKARTHPNKSTSLS